MTEPGRQSLIQAIADLASKLYLYIKYVAIIVPVLPSPALQ